MWHVNAIGAADKAPEHATVRQEHKDAVAEEGRRDREPMHGGVLQPHMGRRDGTHLGCREFQIHGTDVGPFRQ